MAAWIDGKLVSEYPGFSAREQALCDELFVRMLADALQRGGGFMSRSLIQEIMSQAETAIKDRRAFIGEK